MFAITTRSTHRLRPALVLLTAMAVVAAMLALWSRPARASDLGCLPTKDAGPYQISVWGPNSDNSMQPTSGSVRLMLVGSYGGQGVDPGTITCPDADYTVDVAWTANGAPLDSGNPISVSSSDVTTIAYQALLTIRRTSTLPSGSHDETTVVSDTERTAVGFSVPPTVTALSAPSVVLTGQPVQFSATTTSYQPIQSLTWNFGDGSFDAGESDAVTHTYTQRGTYYLWVGAKDTTGLWGSAQATVQVLDPLLASLTVPSASTTVGAPLDVTAGWSTDDPTWYSITAIELDFGDGSQPTGGRSHVYTAPGTYTITERVTDTLGRTGTATHDVTVYPNSAPIASLYIATGNPTAGSPVSFYGDNSTDDNGIVSYTWTFGDGSTATGMRAQHTYARPNSYPVTLTVTDAAGLSSSVTQRVDVADTPPTAAFGWTPTNPVAGGAISFDGTSSVDLDGTIRSYYWEFGDGSWGYVPSPTHTYAKAGSYHVTLMVTDDAGLWTRVDHMVTVGKAPPTAAMTLPNGPVAAAPVTFDGTPSSDADGSVQQYAWDFGDGSTATGATPAHSFAKAGSYTVTLTVTDDDGLTGTTSSMLTVSDASPVAAFSPPAAVAGQSTWFDGLASSDPDGVLTRYHWDFGDGTGGGDGAALSHVYAAGGTFPVTLWVTDDGGKTSEVTHLVTVRAVPTPAFTSAPAAPIAGSAVSFDATGSAEPGGAITGYSWSFGDGGTGTGARPSHAYGSAGTYQVTLTVTDLAGQTAQAVQTVTVASPATHLAATDLAVTATGSVPKPGQYTYRVTVKNLGHTGAHGIVLTNALDPAQLLAGKVTAPAGLTCGGVTLGTTGTITCNAPSAVLAAGKSWVVTFTVKQPARATARQVTETSVVQAANPDGVTRNNTARLTTAV